MKFAFIAREKATFPIDLLCAVIGVSRAGFYAAQRRPTPARQHEDQRLAVHVAATHAASRRRYGSRRPATVPSERSQALSSVGTCTSVQRPHTWRATEIDGNRRSTGTRTGTGMSATPRGLPAVIHCRLLAAR
jgi:hypothetical protein